MAYAMSAERHIRLFRNGRNQAVRIPREFEFAGNNVVMRKEGDKIIIEPEEKKNSLLEWLRTLEPLEEDFPKIEDLPPEPVDL
jgi:antitoxin VapB